MKNFFIRDLPIFALVTLLLGYWATEFIAEYPQTIIALAGVNLILAVSLNLVNGFTGQFSLGHAGFMAVGAYVSATLTSILLPSMGIPFFAENLWGQQIFFAISLLAGGIASAIVGFIVGVPSLRLRGDYLAVVTLGFGEIIRIFILNIEAIGGARGMISIPQFTNLYWIFGLSILSIVGLYRLLQSIPGKQFMAVRDDETATLAMGLSTTRIKVRAFIFASFLAGIAGALFAHFYSYLNPATFNFNYSFQIVAMVVLGGMGSLTGSALAAIFLTVLLEALRPLQQFTGVDLRMVIYSLILIAMMLTRPQGLLGRQEIWEWAREIWHKRRKKKKAEENVVPS